MQSGTAHTESTYPAASGTQSVKVQKVQKVIDPDIAALLDDGDISSFESDVEELEEDFVLLANRPEEGEEQVTDKKTTLSAHATGASSIRDEIMPASASSRLSAVEKPRVRRLIDEQFDLVTCWPLDISFRYDASCLLPLRLFLCTHCVQ